jgi:hypothetical protein
MRCEWARAKARAARWHEELQLIVEEMRRALAFCAYQTVWWDELASAPAVRDITDAALREGKMAYAREHAAQERKMRASWALRWHTAMCAARDTGLVTRITIPDIPEAAARTPPVLDLRRDSDGRDGALEEPTD